MPWQITNMNDVRREFVTKVLQRSASFVALCREFGISRKTGYKWKQRALAEGLSALGEHSRRPRHNPNQLSEAMTCAIIRLKMRHPQWGPKKICQLYQRYHGGAPSISSCQRVLGKVGLVQMRRRRVKRATQRLTSAIAAHAPNDVWTVDFKGWWLLAKGERCEPLTVRDAFSRFLLAVRLPGRADAGTIKAEFVRLFETYGLPKVIRSDNGVPFAAPRSPLGLSRLSAWWVTLGIELDRSRPAHPQDNGAHERMHRDMQAELARNVQPDLPSQQAACDLWREEFNWERPHEALRGKTPGQLYHKSDRTMRAAAPALDYGASFFVRKVNRKGQIKWRQDLIFISHALLGHELGLRIVDADRLEVWLNYLLLGEIELQTRSFRVVPSHDTEAPRLSA